jgi:hypothetical protein
LVCTCQLGICRRRDAALPCKTVKSRTVFQTFSGMRFTCLHATRAMHPSPMPPHTRPQNIEQQASNTRLGHVQVGTRRGKKQAVGGVLCAVFESNGRRRRQGYVYPGRHVSTCIAAGVTAHCNCTSACAAPQPRYATPPGLPLSRLLLPVTVTVTCQLSRVLTGERHHKMRRARGKQ